MKRVLVLGGRGMLGHIVVRTLSVLQGIKIEYTVSGDKDNPFYFNVENGIDQLNEIIKVQGRYNFIINCIGLLNSQINGTNSESVQNAVLINGLFPHQLSKLAQNYDARVIHMSTDGVFSRNADMCLEESQQNYDNLYGKTKSIGEVFEKNFLNLRCSIIGPSPFNLRGIFEWFLSQPNDTDVCGYTNHMWNGVTTLQFANLCKYLIVEDSFDMIVKESSVHHFCPNLPISKFELLKLFKIIFRPDINLKSDLSPDGPMNRILGTQYNNLSKIFGHGKHMKDAIYELFKHLKK